MTAGVLPRRSERFCPDGASIRQCAARMMSSGVSIGSFGAAAGMAEHGASAAGRRGVMRNPLRVEMPGSPALTRYVAVQCSGIDFPDRPRPCPHPTPRLACHPIERPGGKHR